MMKTWATEGVKPVILQLQELSGRSNKRGLYWNDNDLIPLLISIAFQSTTQMLG